MSISDTNAKARAAGMTYGQYCDARDRGLLSDGTEEDTPALSPTPAVHSVQKKIKWTVELKNDLRRLCEDGLSLEEISERLGIDQSKIRTQLGHMKYREGYTPPSHRAPAAQKKSTSVSIKKEAITEAVSNLGKHTIFDSTDPMCILDFIKGIVLESFSPDEITAIYAAREDCIAEMQYKIGEDLWRIQVRKE